MNDELENQWPDATLKDRRGKFRLSPEALEMMIECGVNICDRFIPIAIVEQPIGEGWPVRTYYGYHPSFDIVAEGEQVPEYIGIITRGRHSPAWSRR